MTEDVNNHLFSTDPDPVEDLDVHMELCFSRKNLPKGEMVPVVVDGMKKYITIPPDIKDGTTIKVEDGGKHKPRSGETGDLYVVVHITDEWKFPWKIVLMAMVAIVVLVSIAFLMQKEPPFPPPPTTEATTAKQTEESCVHDWISADCTTPKICRICREISGEPLGHIWSEGTYDAFKICRICGEKEGELPKETEPKLEPYVDYRVGEIIPFGEYEQDNNTGNGKEAIDWIVLDVQRDKVLLLSEKALDSLPYNNEDETTTWEKCDLRSWLNDSFLMAAFTTQQQKRICLTTVDNSASQGNSKWNAQEENDTKDRIFLLSYAESSYYFDSNEERKCYPTKYAAVRRKLGATPYQPEAWWWLRSPGENRKQAAFVNYNGTRYSNLVANQYLSVRPAMWIRKDN